MLLLGLTPAVAISTCVASCSLRKLTCCPIMPLLSAVNGSTTSASPSGLNILQWFLRTTSLNSGSTLTRYASASFSNRVVSVLAAGIAPTSGGTTSLALRFLAGDASSAFTGELWYAMTCEPPGVLSAAFVAWGSAGRGLRDARVSKGWST